MGLYLSFSTNVTQNIFFDEFLFQFNQQMRSISRRLIYCAIKIKESCLRQLSQKIKMVLCMDTMSTDYSSFS
ncbi:hypothetical protein C0T31_00020 [Dysgonamonadaceae bacterium]|nr:hypothetical protein C0T31_00020 [Dysgonamonadaceae bacterium]